MFIIKVKDEQEVLKAEEDRDSLLEGMLNIRKCVWIIRNVFKGNTSLLFVYLKLLLSHLIIYYLKVSGAMIK